MNELIKDFSTALSKVTFGGASLSGEGGGYGFGQMSEAQAHRLIQTAYDQGIVVFDTAPIYGFGLSEERLGKYLPKDALVISKSGVDWHPTKRVNMTNDPVVTLRMLEESLKRLKREAIDLYMVHWPDKNVDIRHTLTVLKKAQESGKIRQIGLCNTNLEELKRAHEVCEITSIQSELNFYNQKSFLDLGSEWKKYFSMGWGTFDKGILSGRVHADRTFSKEDCRSWAPWWNKKDVQLKVERTKKLKIVLDDFSISLPHFCLSYNLVYFGISSCLVGFKSPQDVLEVSSSLQKMCSRETIEEVLERLK